MIHELNINERAFNAIKTGTKKIEIRVNKVNFTKDYSLIEIGDKIIFENLKTKEKIICVVEKNNWYESIEELLQIEGTKYTLSSTNDYNEGIKSIKSIVGYDEGIKKNGVYAIHICYLNEKVDRN